MRLRVTALALAALSTHVSAHHGAVVNPSLYLAENLTEMGGEITEVFWRNPHPRMRLRDEEGTIWELELNGSPTLYRRMGVSADDIARAGDRVRVAGYISRRDSRSLGVLHMLLPNGEEFVNGNREPRWSSERLELGSQPIDPEKAQAARDAADGIFRVWYRFAPTASRGLSRAEYSRLLTSRGRELAAQYDPVTQNPELDCRQGMPKTMTDPTPIQIIDRGERIIVLQEEYDIERTIYMAEQGDAQASRLGHSVGHWEDDVLVVDTTDVDWPYFDQFGTPQSDQARFRETFVLSAEGDQLNYSVTITDPTVFTEPFTIERTRGWTPGIEIEPFDCVAAWE